MINPAHFIKLFIWEQVVEKYYKDWLDDYVNERMPLDEITFATDYMDDRD